MNSSKFSLAESWNLPKMTGSGNMLTRDDFWTLGLCQFKMSYEIEK
jgi:hypothetical protein